MSCKTPLLKRLNRLFVNDYDGFSFENQKYPFSELEEFLKEVKKVSGCRIKVGLVLDDSGESESENESESVSEQQSDSSNKEEACVSKNRSETVSFKDVETSSDDGGDTSFQCKTCEKVYSSPIPLVGRKEKVHKQLYEDSKGNKEASRASHLQRDPRKRVKTHPCSDCCSQYSTRSNLLRHRRTKHIYSLGKTGSNH
jgi:hypothetical protein